MKAISANVYGGVSIGSKIKVDDNSGAKILRIISKEGYRGRRGRIPDIGIGDIFFGSVISGKVEMRKKIMRAVIIRQRKAFHRATGERVRFEDNASVLMNDKNEPQASEIKGVVAKEVAERFPKVATIAKNVI
jgi:large subunit ribosomal protein L14